MVLWSRLPSPRIGVPGLVGVPGGGGLLLSGHPLHPALGSGLKWGGLAGGLCVHVAGQGPIVSPSSWPAQAMLRPPLGDRPLGLRFPIWHTKPRVDPGTCPAVTPHLGLGPLPPCCRDRELYLRHVPNCLRGILSSWGGGAAGGCPGRPAVSEGSLSSGASAFLWRPRRWPFGLGWLSPGQGPPHALSSQMCPP